MMVLLKLFLAFLSIHVCASFQLGHTASRIGSLKPLHSLGIEVQAEASENNSDGSSAEQLVVADDVSSSSSSDASLLTGSDFTEFVPHLPEWLQLRCQECGWNHPTVIQQRAWQAISRKEDVVLQAQTGSGKTLAFLVPLLADIEPNRAAIQAVIVVPTRELGLQVGRVAKRLTAKTPIMIMNILQGSSNKRQRAWAWSEPPQVVIGTPQELTDMVQYGGIRYNSVKYVVVDEVDACLLNNGGSLTTNAGPLHTLLSKHLSPTYDKGGDENEDSNLSYLGNDAKSRPLSRTRQTVFCSATIPQHRHFLKQCVQNQWTLDEPTYVCANPGDVLPPTLSHSYLVASSKEKKVMALRRFLSKKRSKIRKVLVFCEPNRPLDAMAQVIAKDLCGIVWKHGSGEEEERSAAAIISVLRFEDSISDRSSAMLGFQGSDGGAIEGRRNANEDSDGPIRILLSTDHAARGLDVEDVTHVVQFDLPHEADTYVHRAGRAGRLGRDGWVVSLITPDQEFVLQRLANKLGLADDIKCVGRQKK
jgi:superfamily II DNA/RNA helicase